MATVLGNATVSLGDSAAAVADWLSRPSAYPERTARVERRETHISTVFLTDRFAYKLKKPVRFEFLDFSTVDQRHAACLEEVRLNRRLASGVYLDVLPVTLETRSRLKFGGQGQIVDWVVKMKRLPDDRSLDRLIVTGMLTDHDVNEVASLLVGFYQRLPPLTIRSDEYRRGIERHVEANGHDLLEHLDAPLHPAIRRAHAAQWRLLRLAPDELDRRVCDGRIVEGHGDLRPEHIYLAPQPLVIDGIEFNREFRQLDVLDELGFLVMECDRLGSGGVGERILAEYVRASGDLPPPRLLAFHKCYRACVRAKVIALRAEQVAGAPRDKLVATAAEYLSLADRYATALGPPLLLVVRGLPGSGKSTLANAAADWLNIDLLQTDAVRRELFGPDSGRADFDAGRYQAAHRAQVYETLFRRAENLLAQGTSVILDGTFLASATRDEAVRLAQRHGAAPLIAHCVCPDDVALARIAERLESGSSLSETRPEFFENQRQLDEPDTPGSPVVEIETTQDVPSILDTLLTRLRSLLLPIGAASNGE